MEKSKDDRRKITVQTYVADSVLASVLTTALDPGYGGSLYWAEARRYRDHKFDGDSIGFWIKAEVRDVEAGSKAWRTVNLDTVAKGIERVLGGGIKLAPEYLAQVSALLGPDADGGEVDALGADVILQAGLLGDVVYG